MNNGTPADGQRLRAQVTAAHGRHFGVLTEQGASLLARPMGRRLQIVCGDVVLCQRDARHDELHIVAVEPRRTALYRSDSRGRDELLAANVSMLLIVLAPVPEPDLFMIDRYLCAATSAGLEAALIVNKCELATADADAIGLAEFRRLGYRCLPCSAHTGAGLAELLALINGQRVMLVGQSGVGKSSLLRALAPDSAATIGELMRDTEGRHTTTTTRSYALPQGGELLDSPGVRDFAPALARLDAASLGFVEVAALAPHCRFGDCRHLQEPDCALRTAVHSGEVSARRYESYRRLRRLYERLHDAHR